MASKSNTTKQSTNGTLDDLALKLQQWSLDEMKFCPQGKHVNSKVPEYDDFKDICRGPMADIWKYIIENVHSAQTVKKVKGNLALKGHQKHRRHTIQQHAGSKVSKEKEKLYEERTHISGQLGNSVSDVKHLETELKRLEKDIIRTEREYKSCTEELEDLDKKSSLLEVFSRQCNETTLNYDNFSDKIQAKTKAITEKSIIDDNGQPLLITKPKSVDVEERGKQLETVCDKHVRETCEKLEGFLNKTLQGSFGTDKTTFHTRKDQLWSEVEKVLSDFRTGQIVTAMVSNTQDATFNLHDKTNKINVRKDAEQLRFKYEQGELTDMSMPPTVLQSVRQLIEVGQSKHVQKFFDSEKHKNQAWRSRQKLDEIKQSVEKLLIQRFHDKPGELQLARTLVDTKLALAADKSGLHCCLSEAEQLREEISKGIQEKEILQSKFYKIKSFRELAEQKQNLIRVLAKQNLNARTRLDSQQSEISKYIKSSLTSHCTATQSLTGEMVNRVSREVDQFSTLSLPYLMFLYPDGCSKVCGLDLSINHYHHPVCITHRQPLQTLLHSLQFPSYKAPECLLPWCLKLKTDIENYINLMETQNTSSQRVYGPNRETIDNIENISELCKLVSDNDQRQRDTLVPVLQSSTAVAKDSLKQCKILKADVQAWIEQPAQFATPWVEYDGQTYKQLLAKWTVLCTKLRQLQVAKKEEKQ